MDPIADPTFLDKATLQSVWFLLLTVLGPMLLAGQGSFNAIHGRPQAPAEVPDKAAADAVNDPSGTADAAAKNASTSGDAKTQEPGR